MDNRWITNNLVFMRSILKHQIIFIFFALFSLSAVSQTAGKPDREKLLELYQSQRYLDAAQYLQQVYPQGTDNIKELSEIAYANLMANRLPEAESHYLKILETDSANTAVLMNLANINAKRMNNEKAMGFYGNVLKLDSTNFIVYKRMAALVGGDIRQTVKKIRLLEKANQLNPSDGEVVFDLSELYFKLMQFSKAEKILDTALRIDTANIQLWKMVMPVSMGLKKYEDAIVAGQKAFALGDTSVFVLNNMGKSHFLLNQYQQSLDYFLKIKGESSQSEALYLNISRCYRGLNDYKNAIKYLEMAIKEGISPEIANYYGLIGDAYEKLNMNNEANVAYKKGLNFDNNGSLLYNIALVYETKLNDKKTAINYYNQYLKTIDPKQQPKLVRFINSRIDDLNRRLKAN